MSQVDTALVVSVVGRHVVGADGVVEAGARATHRCNHIVARTKLCNVRADRFYLAEAFVSSHQELITVGRSTVFCSIDFFVRAIHSDSQDPYQDSPTIGDIADTRLWQFCEMNRVGLARKYCDGFHDCFSCVLSSSFSLLLPWDRHWPPEGGTLNNATPSSPLSSSCRLSLCGREYLYAIHSQRPRRS